MVKRLILVSSSSRHKHVARIRPFCTVVRAGSRVAYCESCCRGGRPYRCVRSIISCGRLKVKPASSGFFSREDRLIDRQQNAHRLRGVWVRWGKLALLVRVRAPNGTVQLFGVPNTWIWVCLLHLAVFTQPAKQQGFVSWC